MKPLLLLAMIVALGVGARAEVFRPPIASGRDFHHPTRVHVRAGHGHPHFGHGHGYYRGGFRHWHDRDAFWGWGLGTGFTLGYGTGYFDYGYGWPWRRYYGNPWYDDWPFYEARAPVYRSYPVVEPVRVVQPVVIQVGDGLRDARSPEQLRAIYGAQAEGLIRGN